MISIFLSRLSSRATGIFLVLLSAFVFSSGGIFTKGVHARAWDIIFWRGLFGTAFTLLYVWWRGSLKSNFLALGKMGWIAAIVGASSTAAYIPAFKLTSIANVSLIYAVTPLISALLAWWCIGERAALALLVASVVSLLGVFIIVGGSVGSMHLTGDLLACYMALSFAVGMVIFRAFPRTPAAGVSATSSILLMPLALAFGAPFTNSLSDILVMIAFGLSFAIASITLSEGTKRLPAAEASLLSILEVVFAPILAWAVFVEIPAQATLAGGALILVSVVATQVWPRKTVPAT
jgi:drug/metabolite transporter (DMT)-like permease